MTEKDPPGNKRYVNSTAVRTKSGTEVIVFGKAVKGNATLRSKVGDKFVNVYNRNFTVEEQKQIGNILYDLYENNPDSSSGTLRSKNTVAQTGTFTGEQAQEFNPHHKKMVDMQFAPDARYSEGTITHELIHAKKFMVGIKGRHHNERKIDFETIGRIRSVSAMDHGYYFSPAGNPYLAKKRIPLTKKREIVERGVRSDRILLTGALSKSITGKVAEQRVNRLFPRSFFFKRKF